MILVALAEYHKGQPVSAVMDAIATVHMFASIEPEKGVMAFNETFRVFGPRLDYGIAMKNQARRCGMRFIQPINKMKDLDFWFYMRYQMGQRGYTDGNYLMLPDGWHLTGVVDVKAIVGQLAEDSCNFVLLPTPDDEVHPRKPEKPEFEPSKDSPLWRPHFGNLATLAEKDIAGVFAWSNGGRFKPVCAKLRT